MFRQKVRPRITPRILYGTWGRKTYQRTRPPEKFWTPPKELLVCSVVDFCTGKTEERRPRGAGKRTVRRGVQHPLPEFAQPRLSRVKGRSSPARGCKFGCARSYMAGHYPGILMTGHIGTTTPKFIPSRWG